ncbi:MAG: AAA family ATPase [Helicobacteraceae bacterium]|jgi:DNA transposition AAA+ family ATPase|nr:AAA family ATPase [Helicobacteraceae bacterium]
MTEEFIVTDNHNRLLEAAARLKLLPQDAPRMGIGYGNFGLGKTMSIARIAAMEGALLFRASSTWSKSAFLTSLCEKLGLDVSDSASIKYKRAVDHLNLEPKTIIIDEIDALLRSDKISILEILRDIHDETPSPLLLIGMESCDGKLKRHQHFYSRIVERVVFSPAKIDDIARFAKLSKIAISQEVVDYLAQKYPNFRQIKVMFLRLENWCETNGRKSATLKEWKAAGVELGIVRI